MLEVYIKANERLTSGQIVRFIETVSRWQLARVCNVRGNQVELAFFDRRESIKVSRGQVETLDEFFGRRERVLSVDRSRLTAIFYGREIQRLRNDKVHKMKGVLHKAGIAFEPEGWPKADTRIRLRLDDSFVPARVSSMHPRTEALLPHWLAPQRLPPSSRDPLGLQAYAERLANKLLPGLTVFTSRIGYYGFLAWAIQTLNTPTRRSGMGLTRRELLNRLERTLALCEFIHHGAYDDSCVLLGQRSKMQLLQNAERNRYHVPTRILKNQNSAGAFALYMTSLASFGFTVEAPELGVEGLLPYLVSDLGNRIAGAFARRVPGNFVDFALSNDARDRDKLRDWGRRICFSALGSLGQYREAFIEGFIRGNSIEAERRFLTIRCLFKRGLLTGRYDYEQRDVAPDVTAEEYSAVTDGAPEVKGLGNDRVLLQFYNEAPTAENRDFQTAAVFEFLGLGLAALFKALVGDLHANGRTKISTFSERILQEANSQTRKLWRIPLPQFAANSPGVRALIQDIFHSEAENSLQSAVQGGILLGVVLSGRAFSEVAHDLVVNTPISLVNSVVSRDTQHSLEVVLPELLKAMVERHQEVSINKGRQRWCYLDGDAIVKDDLQEMSLGFHSLRFPQLFSLCRDINLQAKDLSYGN